MKWRNESKTGLLLAGIILCTTVMGTRLYANFIFGEPTLVPNINGLYSTGAPQISRDGLEMYGNFNTLEGQCSSDVWVARRPTTQDPWSVPTILPESWNSTGPRRTPSISADGLELYFSDGYPNVTDCTPNVGGYGHSDLWVSTRASRNDPWSAPRNLGPTINTSNAEDSPCLSSDGLELYFSSRDESDPRNGEICMTIRPSKDAPWGEPVNLGTNVNSSQYEYTPFISPDGLSLFFSRGFSKAHIWVSRRLSITAPWGRAELFAPVNSGTGVFMSVGGSDGTEFCLSYSEEDSTIYFNHGTNVFTYDYQVWQVEVTPIVDLNGDSVVDILDAYELLEHWETTDNSLYDIAPFPFGDGKVDAKDLRVLAEHMMAP